MSIELPDSVEDQLRRLAASQGRDVRALFEEAVRLYLDSAAITELDRVEVAATQMTLAGSVLIDTGDPFSTGEFREPDDFRQR